MALFHFHIGEARTGKHHRTFDLEGSELLDAKQARREAIRLAGDLLYDLGESVDFPRDWEMEVMDAAGVLLYRVRFDLTEYPPPVDLDQFRGPSAIAPEPPTS